MNIVIIRLFYIFFILLLFELSLFTSYKVLNDKILFSKTFEIKKFNLLSFEKFYHKELGWNELGFRENRKKINVISCLGDSFTFGDEVSNKESWPWLLNSIVNGNVQNFGVRGYGTDQSLLKLEQLIKNDNTKLYILSFISKNIARNLSVYRPFYKIKVKYHYTKPRFIKTTNPSEYKLLPNPIKSSEDGYKLFDNKFLERIGLNDFWYKHQDPLPSTFPYSKLAFKSKFWQKIYKLITEPNNQLLKFNLNSDSLWKNKEALDLQNFLVNKFFNLTADYKKNALIMHLPTKTEVLQFQKNGTIPLAILETKKECKLHQYSCLFPLLDISEFKNTNPSKLYVKYHFSKKSNLLIANYLKEKLNMFSQK